MDGWDGQRIQLRCRVCMYVWYMCMGIYESLRFFGLVLDYPRDLYLNSKPCST